MTELERIEREIATLQESIWVSMHALGESVRDMARGRHGARRLWAGAAGVSHSEATERVGSANVRIIRGAGGARIGWTPGEWLAKVGSR